MSHAYNSSCIPQMGICRDTIVNVDIGYQCNFFVVPVNGYALLGMPECENRRVLSTISETAYDQQKRQINKVTKHNKSNSNNNVKDNPHTNNKLQGKGLFYCMSRHRREQSGECKNNIKIHDEFSDAFTGIECFKGTISLKVRDGVKPYLTLPRNVAYSL